MFRKIILIVLILLAVKLQIRLWTGESSYAHVSGLDQEIEDIQARIRIKEERNRILLAEIGELKTGLDSLEELARTELGMIKTGETFYLVIDRENR